MDQFSYWEAVTGQSRKVARTHVIILYRLCWGKTWETRGKKISWPAFLAHHLIFNKYSTTKERSNDDSYRRSGKWHSLSYGAVIITQKASHIPLNRDDGGLFQHDLFLKWRIILHCQFAVCYLRKLKSSDSTGVRDTRSVQHLVTKALSYVLLGHHCFLQKLGKIM